MAASGVPQGVLPVIDVLKLEQYEREGLGELQIPPHAFWSSYEWEKTDLSASVAVAVSASRQVLGGDVRAVGGWSVSETTGAGAADVRFRDGAITGEVITRITLTANSQRIDWPTGHGVRVYTGRVFMEVITGSVEGVIYWR